jgi:outer membrane protein assembly factor BamB
VTLALLTLLVVQEGPVASPEAGWPQWRGPRRDGLSHEKGLLPSWPEAGPKLLWRIDHLGRGWSSPIVVGDRLFITGDVGDDLVLYAFDLAGKPVWQASHGRAWKGEFPGARACPAFSEGRLYHMNAHGHVTCLDSATGKEIWGLNILERFEGRNLQWATSECLLVDGPRVIVTPGGRKALMAALDKTSGAVVWATEPLGKDTATYASPILVRQGKRRLLVSCASEHGFGVDADAGRLLWTVPLKTPYDVNASTPVWGDGQVHFATPYFTAGAYRLIDDGAKVDLAWPTPFDTCTGSWTLAGGLLYGGGYGKFKHWIAVDWKTGEKRAELRDLATGAAVFADGRLYALAQDGQAALASLPDFKVVSRFPLTPKPVGDAWAHPVLLDGRLYLRYHDTLWCFDVRGP